MNRTDRLYALVELLRAAAPRARSARNLAERFEVSVRTIERDISALQESGVPIWATPGPRGGYTVDPAMTLPPLNLTQVFHNVGHVPFMEARDEFIEVDLFAERNAKEIT